MVLTNPVRREKAVKPDGMVRAPTAPGIGYETLWDVIPWEGKATVLGE